MADWNYNKTSWGGVKASVDVKAKVIEDMAIKRQIKSDKEHYLIADQIDELCPTPAPGERYHIVTEKRLNAYSFILSQLRSAGIDELYLAIYRINESIVRSLIAMISEDKIHNAHFIISSFFQTSAGGSAEKWAKMLCDFCRENSIEFAYLHNHSKICCVKNSNGYFVFEGSGNMSDNARIEQYTYENNQAVYDFHTRWMQRLINSVK